MSRRLAIRGSLATAASLARAYIANAQAKTAVYWAGQASIPQEDTATRKVYEDCMKQSGNKLDYSLMPFMALNQKTISALTSGDVPDLIFMDAPDTILPQIMVIPGEPRRKVPYPLYRNRAVLYAHMLPNSLDLHCKSKPDSDSIQQSVNKVEHKGDAKNRHHCC
jgi:hypothetical protein